MGLIGNVFGKALSLRTQIKVAPLRKSAAQADNLMDFIHPVIAPLYEIAQPRIVENIREWNLDNKVLMTFLGYLAGIVSTAEAAVTKNSHSNIFPPREIAFSRLVKGFFGDLPKTNVWLSITENKIHQNIRPNQIGDLLEHSHEFRTALEASSELFSGFLSTSSDNEAGALLILRLEILLRQAQGEKM